MLSDVKLRDLPPLAAEFWRKAQEFVASSPQGWVEIVPGTVECDSWERYFRRQGWEPFALRAIRKGHIKMMVMPSLTPELFDLGFVDDGDDKAPFPVMFSRTRPLDLTTPGRRANLFVSMDSPHYERARGLAHAADPADWKYDAGRRGLWVSASLWSS